MMTPVDRHKHLQLVIEHQNWILEQWRKIAWSDELYRKPYLGQRSYQDALWEEGSVMSWECSAGKHVDVILTPTSSLEEF